MRQPMIQPMVVERASDLERGQNGIAVELVPSSEQSLAASRWQALAQRIGDGCVTNTWAWIDAWIGCFGDTIPHTYALAVKDGETIGAALITQAPLEIGPLAIPSVFLGTGGEGRRDLTYVQYNRLLVAQENKDCFAESLMARLVRLRWSVLRLNGFVPEDAEALVKAGKKAALQFRVEAAPSPTYDFRQAGPDQDVLSTLSRDTRSKMRRSMRFLTEKLGPLTLEWAETREQACDILSELIALHTLQWNSKGETGALHSERVQKYHESMIDVLFPQHLIAFRVKQGETTIGCLFNLVENGRITNHRSGVRFFPDDRLKPGYVTDLLFMEEARKRGYAEYDLLVGHEYYKRLITNAENTLVWATAGRGVRSQVFEAARKLYWSARTRPFIRKIERAVFDRD
jgi:Acetyltransferase (GNAT) domain